MTDDKNLMKTETLETTVAPVSDKTITDYLAAFGLANQLTKQEQMQFVEVAKAYNLNPFKREIYCIPYGGGDRRKLSIITGYETYLKRAEHTGLLDGWECSIEGQGQNMKAVATIRRKGWSMPFKHEVYLVEYDQHNSMWNTKPRTMLKKVAIAQAFRLCFPDDMGGMPYTSDELPDEMTIMRDVTPAPAPAEAVEEIQGDWEPQSPQPVPAPAPAPEKRKATPAEIEEMAKIAKDLDSATLEDIKAKYMGAPDIMIEKMREARIAKLKAGTLRQERENDKYSFLPPEQREQVRVAEAKAKAVMEKEATEPPRQKIGEPVGNLDIFPDDSEELYK